MKLYAMLGVCLCDTISLNVHNVPHTGTSMNTLGLFFMGRHYQTDHIMIDRQLYSNTYNITTLLRCPIFNLTLRLLISYIYGAPSKARNANVVYTYGPTFGNAETVSFYLLHTFVCKHFAS